MPVEEKTPRGERWWVIALRHFTTICAIIGMMWWVATPRVEAYIRNVVSDRINIIEDRLDTQDILLKGIKSVVDSIKKDTKENVAN